MTCPRFLKAALLMVAVLAGRAGEARADDSAWSKQTVVYKTVGETSIEADVYRDAGTQPRAVLVWIHGGALIMGNRNGVPKNLIELARTNRYALVSLDYRLAPQARLAAIIADVQDAFRWIHTDARKRFHLDTQRVVVAGGSAGGYLTMMSGICVLPRPTALVAYWGYGDVDGPWYTEPSAHYRRQPLVTREQALAAVAGEVTTDGDGRTRGAYYLYLRQNGLWTREVTGFDPQSERAKLDAFCPVRQITPAYPPILMIHGTADTDVPYQESADMADALKKQGVAHEVITIEGGDHGLSDRTNPAVIDAHRRAEAFIREHLDV